MDFDGFLHKRKLPLSEQLISLKKGDS